MSSYGYSILIQTIKRSDKKCDDTITTYIGSKEVADINTVLRAQYDNERYNCHLDHIMLYSIELQNFNTRTSYKCLYIISLSKIEHPLFIPTNEVFKKFGIRDGGRSLSYMDIYNTYPSFRFNKFHVGNFFELDSSNAIVFNELQTNSHDIVHN